MSRFSRCDLSQRSETPVFLPASAVSDQVDRPSRFRPDATARILKLHRRRQRRLHLGDPSTDQAEPCGAIAVFLEEIGILFRYAMGLDYHQRHPNR